MKIPFHALLLAAMALAGCSPSGSPPNPALPTAGPALSQASAQPAPAAPERKALLLKHVWELRSPEGRPPRSIYVFLPDGSLLMTSCVETYRIARWQMDGEHRIQIDEDSQTRYLADILELDDSSLRLKLNLISEELELGFRKAEPQTVCPDLPR